jgi:hypothetical protein
LAESVCSISPSPLRSFLADFEGDDLELQPNTTNIITNTAHRRQNEQPIINPNIRSRLFQRQRLRIARTVTILGQIR